MFGKATILLLAISTCLTVAGCSRCNREPADRGAVQTLNSPSGPKVTCPVCGLSFPKSEAVGSVTVSGKKYYFFLKDHLKAFKDDPDSFLSKE